MIVGRAINKIINIFTGLFGIATVVLLLVIYLNNSIGGIIPADALNSIVMAKDYCTLGTVFCAGLEFTLKRNIVLAAIFAAILVAVGAFMLYYNFAVMP